jgi:hypothetical protein
MMVDKVDYAPHYLEAKQKIDAAYKKLLVNDYEEAATLISETIAELRLMRAAVRSYVE